MKKSKKIIASMIFSFILIFLGIFTQEVQGEENNFCYLSNIPYVANKSSVGWREITYDKTPDNTPLSVKVEGVAYTFEKGIFAHATSTVVYDLTNYSEYAYFTAYLGLNTTSTRGDGVKFDIFTSVDGITWESKLENGPLDKLPGQNATFVKIDIRDANFLKLVADDKLSNASDHSVYADAKIIKATYEEPGDELVPSVEELDTKIKQIVSSNNLEDLENNTEYEYTLLKRELIKNVGNYALKRFLSESTENQEVFRWLIGNKDSYENLKLYILGGKPDGDSYYNALTVLSKLYKEYSSDFDNTQLLNNPTNPNMTYGDLYKKMAMSISLTHSQTVGLWMQSSIEVNKSEPLRRYAIYKYIHNTGGMRISAAMDMTHVFEDLHIQEMRLVVFNNIDDEEILWLNRYTQDHIDANPNNVWRYQTPHPYIAYIWPNYANPVYYAEENIGYFNELFAVNKTNNNVGTELVNSDGEKTGKIGLFDSEFVIPGGANIPEYRIKVTRGTPEYRVYKVWMNFRNKFGTGCVCGGISKSGANIRGVHGIPAMVIGQPGHAALMFYSKDGEGRGYWRIDNDVSGWTLSGGGGRLLRWGSGSYASGYSNGVYVELEQAAINDYQNLLKAEKLVMLAKMYGDDPIKQEEIYRKALEIQSINFDAWLGLIDAYKANEAKTEDEFYSLAEEVAENLKYYPLPMTNAINLIKPKLTSVENSYKFTLLQERTLVIAKNLPNNTANSFTVMQPGVTRLEASYLLGQTDTTIASFSFDGEDSNKIVLSSRFDGSGVRWDYCIDGNPQGGAEHWHEVSFDASEEHKLLLTPEEIASITAENDIYVHIVGVDYSEENLYKIDILESAGFPATLYANDLENKLMSASSVMKWKLNENDEWKLYSEEEPDLSGDKTVIVKMAATGVRLESKEERTFNFTANTDPDTRKYIPISHLSIHAVSTEATSQGRHATNAIDGNINTNWHSAWNGSDTEKYIVIKLDEPKNLTALEYQPAAGGNGKILSAQILTSLDGENWTETVSGTEWTYRNTNDISLKSVEFNPVKAQYIKILGKRTQAASAGSSFMVAAMFNLYENKAVEIVGTYSFDGENGGKIALLDEYKNLNWKYSLDSGTTWNDGRGEVHQLTTTEMNQINEDNKIKIKFEGNETVYAINILKGEIPNITPYLNDWENRLIGVNNTNTLEWKLEDDENWKSYSEEEPIVEGNKKLLVRNKATGIYTASDAIEYQFTEGTDTDGEKYIPISHLSIHDYSTQSIDSNRPFYAPNVIDGNVNTLWHTDFRYSITGKRAHITIKLDKVKSISALEFVQKKYRADDPCMIRNAFVYVSENGIDWIEAGRLQNCEQNEEFKKIKFSESIFGQYVKLEMEGYGIFASAAMINLYEDTTKVKVADFSFDGENSGKIILTDEFKASNWSYSLDSGITWKQGTGDAVQLEDEEIEELNADDKIKIRIENNSQEYTINIQKTEIPVISAYLNDLENRLIGVQNKENLEWKIVENTQSRSINTEWTNFSEEEPVVEGNKKLLIRAKARGIFTSSEVIEYQFTDDNQEDTRKYVPVSRLSIANVSAEDKAQNGAAANAIDGNYNTRWLNSAAGTDTQKYIVIKFDSALYLSAMDYVPHAENGKILEGTIEGSMDGENFTEIAQISGWANNQNTKTINFEEAVKVRYVKITGTVTSYTSAKRHIGARMFNFYEDITKKEVVIPTAEVEYDITTLTNQNVVATLVNPSTEITVINNDGNMSHTFTENGSFIFEFEDSEGNKGSATATVDWICKTLPNATFTYDITEPTNKDVTVTITFDRPGTTVTNNNGSNQYTFTENGNFTFEFRGPYGNQGTATANVDWICKTLPNATFSYDITEKTNKPVTVTVAFDRENVTILNNNGSNQYTFEKNGEFTFEFRGPYGNEGVATARVDWIDTTTPTADIIYNITEKTNQDVVATLDIGDKNLTITNNNGSNQYTFEENGNFTFEFEDSLGNKGTSVANVSWIDKTAPTATIIYSITEPTNQEVTATVTFDESNVRITNNDGNNTYTFTENSEFTFNFVDEAGNTGSKLAKVTWIDKTLPVATITYSETNPTNQDVIATVTFNKENVTVVGGNTHTFTENGRYEFEYVGPAGNAGAVIAEVTWIDKTVPEATVVYSAIASTNQNVTATVVFENEKEGEVTILNNGGKNQYTFTENGEFIFEFSDKAGNKGVAKAIVNNIDKIAPTATVTYDVTEATNGKVVASLSDISEDITVTNNDGNDTYTFTENGEFTFEFVDRAGNEGRATARVTWIDKLLPVATIIYSTTELTNQDVIATITFDKENITVEGGNTHTFTENGEFTFEYADESGNSGMATAEVNWIDKVLPIATISYNITSTTNQDVVATITFNKENVTVEGGNTHTFTENDEYIFKYRDAAGNEGTAIATVTWIEKKPDIPVEPITPSFDLSLETSKETLNPGDEFEVIVKSNNMKNFKKGLIALAGKFEYDKEKLEMIEISGQNNWNLDKNSFNDNNFKFVTESNDYMIEDGIIFKVVLKVKETVEVPNEVIFKLVSIEGSNAEIDISTNNSELVLKIEEKAKISSNVYVIKNTYISRVAHETTVKAFKENIETNRQITIVDKNGNILQDNNIIGTGMTVKVGEELEYTIIVIGDINSDGKVTITDIAKLKLHLIEKEILTGIEFMAGDINGDGEITVTDLAQIKSIFLELPIE